MVSFRSAELLLFRKMQLVPLAQVPRKGMLATSYLARNEMGP